MSEKFNVHQDLEDNPVPKLAVCLCLDASGSMDEVVEGETEKTGETVEVDGKTYSIVTGGISKKQKLLEGVQKLYASIKEDPIASKSAEIAVVTFDDSAKVIEEFSLVDKKKPLDFNTGDLTNLGAGVDLALDRLISRKEDYKHSGVEYYQPWLILITDGHPSDMAQVKAVQERTKHLEKEKKLVVMSVGVGPDADMNVLNGFSNKTPAAFKLQGAKFEAFFNFLSASFSGISNSQTDEKVKLPVDMMRDWAEI